MVVGLLETAEDERLTAGKRPPQQISPQTRRLVLAGPFLTLVLLNLAFSLQAGSVEPWSGSPSPLSSGASSLAVEHRAPSSAILLIFRLPWRPASFTLGTPCR